MKRAAAVLAVLLLAAGAACAEDPALEPAPIDDIPRLDPGEAPLLRVTSPQHGDAVPVAFELVYEIERMDVPAEGHIHVIWGDPGSEFIVVQPTEPSGTLVVEGVPAGLQDLVFALAYPDHSLVPSPAAAITISGVDVGGAGG